MRQTIKLLALIEATTVTGPAKNLINFCRSARSADWESKNLPLVETSIVTFQRGTTDSPGPSNSNSQHDTNAFITAARDAGITVDVLYERFRFDPKVIAQLRRVVEDRSPDIIQTHMIKSHFLTRLSGLGRQYPWVAFHHGYTTTDWKMQIYNQLNRWSLPSATKVVTVCGPFARRLVSEGVSPERLFIRHNSINSTFTNERANATALKQSLGIKNEEQVVLAVGRFSREKGHLDLIEAMGMLSKDHPDVRYKLVLVGDGPERPAVESKARELGIDDNIIFVGQVGNVSPYYAVADVVVLPSHSEGSPNVLLEAMASRVPVVATDVGGVSEIATNEESALIVPPRQPRLFAAALARLLSDSALRLKLTEAAAARAASDFSPQSYTRSLLEFYDSVMKSTTQTASVVPSD
jgi:glycosyltransferase involved in cell wall biosynthesis